MQKRWKNELEYSSYKKFSMKMNEISRFWSTFCEDAVNKTT